MFQANHAHRPALVIDNEDGNKENNSECDKDYARTHYLEACQASSVTR